MVRFRNTTMESICEAMLEDEENRLKLVMENPGGAVNNGLCFQISSSDLAIEIVSDRIVSFEKQLKAAKKALALCMIAKELGADSIYEEGVDDDEGE